MLVHFRCDACGADLVAQAQFAGRHIRCSVCRHTVMVAKPSTPPPLSARAANPAEDSRLADQIARQADEDARRIAWDEARRSVGRGRLMGIALTSAGTLTLVFGVLALRLGRALWIPRSSCAMMIGLGIVVLMIGIAVWRLAAETLREEFRRRVPGIADRLRQQYWSAQQTRGSTPPSRAAVG